ncbi:MAG TPA: DUF6265 family protein, partial [Candidatus Krumholzibacteria bacterium]|nr:DUF6265 family protein [Candidatus Krumholzibacteria bacterium]
MRVRLTAGLLCLAATTLAFSPVAAQTSPDADLASLQWLTGTWTGSSNGVESEEHWSRADGGLMTGMHRDIRGDKVVLFEFLRIEERDGTLVYIAL